MYILAQLFFNSRPQNPKNAWAPPETISNGKHEGLLHYLHNHFWMCDMDKISMIKQI